MITYSPSIYDPKETDPSFRFSLGMDGRNPLFVIGLNPSTADDKESDMTIKKVMGFADRSGYDGFIMLNLYAQRTPYPEKIHNTIDVSLHKKNLKKIALILMAEKNPSVLAGWGEKIKVKPFLIDCLTDIFHATSKHEINWLQIGDLTSSKHPRHPSRTPYRFGLTKFNIASYLVSQRK